MALAAALLARSTDRLKLFAPAVSFGSVFNLHFLHNKFLLGDLRALTMAQIGVFVTI